MLFMKVQEFFQTVFNEPLYLLFGVLGAAVFVVGDLGRHRKKQKSHTNRYRTGKLLKLSSLKKAHGIIFGRIGSRKVLFSPADDEGHVIVFGGSGLGKTSAVLIPSLQSYAKNPSNTCFAIDLSGDIIENSNLPGVTYDVTNPASAPYDIFAPVDFLKTEAEKNKALAIIAFSLKPDLIVSGDSAGSYYNKKGRDLLTAALISYYHLGRDFPDIARTVNTLDGRALLNEILDIGNPAALPYISGISPDMDAAQIANIADSCADALAPFVSDEALSNNIRRHRKGEPYYSPSILENQSCFVRVPESDLDYYRPVLQLIVTDTFNYLHGRPLSADHQILLALDEVASLGLIDLNHAADKLRKHKVRIFALTQSIASLDLTWGRPYREAMMPNFRYQVVLESNTPQEQDYWASLAGKAIYTSWSSTSGPTGKSQTQSEHKDYALEPSSLAYLDEDLLLFYPGGYVKLRKNYFWKN